MAEHLILTSSGKQDENLKLFIGDAEHGKDYEIDIRKQIMWLRTLMASVDRYLEKNVT